MGFFGLGKKKTTNWADEGNHQIAKNRYLRNRRSVKDEGLSTPSEFNNWRISACGKYLTHTTGVKSEKVKKQDKVVFQFSNIGNLSLPHEEIGKLLAESILAWFAREKKA